MSGVQSIERAFVLLRALAVGPAGITELAERSDLPKSTVARLVSALESEGAVEQVTSGGDYRLGSSLADLAGASAPGRNLIAAARPHLLELTERTGETSGLSILEDGMVYYLDHVESEEEVLVRSWTGERVPAHLVPSGLILLAALPASEVRGLLAGPLEAATPASVTDPAEIRDRLRLATERGYIWTHSEFDESLSSVAAPVTDHDGITIAAIHLHGPAYRFPSELGADETGKLIKEAAERLSLQLD